MPSGIQLKTQQTKACVLPRLTLQDRRGGKENKRIKDGGQACQWGLSTVVERGWQVVVE